MSDSNLPAVVDLIVYHGDTWAQTFRLKQGTTPVDLTGATIAAWAQKNNGAVIHLAVTITNAAGGEFQLAAGPDGLPSTTYTYDVEVTQAAIVTTWIRGALNVTADVTNYAAV